MSAQGDFEHRVFEAYDGTGRLLHEGRETGTSGMSYASHAYDGLHRLASSSRTDGAFGHTFDYDALGNLRQKVDQLTGKKLDVVPSGSDPDRVFEVKGCGGVATTVCRYKYDGIGNVTEIVQEKKSPMNFPIVERVSTFKYDSASRLIGIADDEGTASLAYGAFGQLTEIVVNAKAKRRERRYGDLVSELEVDGTTLIERRIPGPLGTLMSVRGTSAEPDKAVVYHHGDPAGNRVFTDRHGTIVQSVDYDPFGTVLADSGTPGTDHYSYEQWNFGDAFRDFGVVLIGARLYHPTTGRFLQRDPIIASSTGSGGNPYAFSYSDPVNFTDPTGLTSVPTIWASWSPSGPPSSFPDWAGPTALVAGKLLYDVIGRSAVQSVNAQINADLARVHNYVASLPRASWGNRIGGGFRVVGGLLEGGVGAALMFVPGGQVAGALLLAHAADTTSAGLMQTFSGQHARTMTSRGIEKGFGVSANTADLLDDGINMFGTLGGGAALNASRRATTEIAELVAKARSSPNRAAASGVPALRQQYVDEVTRLGGRVPGMRQAGMSSEQIARALHAERRALGVKFKDLTPADKLAEIHARNLSRYGDKLGPSIEWLRNAGKSWDDIIESATRTGGKDLGF